MLFAKCRERGGAKGPMLDREGLKLVSEALERLESGFPDLPDFHPQLETNSLRAVLFEVADRMWDNYPYSHPLYAGQMLKPPHPIARLSYQLAQSLNPNNHALDGGRASSEMEKEAVSEIAAMFCWETHLGHLTGGGTMANLEALWVSGVVTERKTALASTQAHYTHSRICGVLGLPFESVPVDSHASMDAAALEERLERGGVGTVVVTLGTTATGSCDPLREILALRERHGFRIHLDAAYGGYYTLAGNLRPETSAAYDLIAQADSIVVDPHKHGLQPYGCGCVLFKDPSVGALYKHDSPYTYFTSAELHLGEISLECSRPGAAAVALWATQRLLPLKRGGEFAKMLTRCREAALKLYARLERDSRFVTGFPPELDIVVWAVRAETPEDSSRLARAIFEEAAKLSLHLALANLPVEFLGNAWTESDQGTRGDKGDEVSDTVTCLRSCLMKPEHLDWLDALWTRLDAATTTVTFHRE